MRVILKVIFFLAYGLVVGQNLVDVSTWTEGSGPVPGFEVIGKSQQNIREIGEGPYGNSVLLWKAVPDGVNSTVGGFRTEFQAIDSNKTYRFSVWVKKTNSLDGFTEFGLSANDASGSRSYNRIDGVTHYGNPFVRSSAPDTDEWFLFVGFIHGASYAETESIGGVYSKTTGEKVQASVDYKFTAQTTQIRQRFWLAGNTNTSDRQYFYAPSIYEVNGQEPSLSVLLNGDVDVADTQAPTAPTGLESTATGTSTVDLSWLAATDDTGVTGYNVYKDGVLEATLGAVLFYQVTGLTPQSSYNFTVTSLDAANNESTASGAVTITTNVVADTQAPTAPTGLTSTVTGTTTADLSWLAATDNTGVTGYNIYKDDVLETTLGAVLSYQITGLTPGNSYSFTVTGLDAANNESALSTRLSLTTLTEDPSGEPPVAQGGYWTLSGQDIHYNGGKVGIGTATPDTALAVNGTIHSREVRIDLNNWPDYVFATGYDLPSLEVVAAYIGAHGHLPNMPSAEEIKANGALLGAINIKLLEKIEELTLYTLEQEKALQAQKAYTTSLEGRVRAIEAALIGQKK